MGPPKKVSCERSLPERHGLAQKPSGGHAGLPSGILPVLPSARLCVRQPPVLPLDRTGLLGRLVRPSVIFQYARQPVHPSALPSVGESARLSVRPSVRLSAVLLADPSAHPSGRQSVRPPVHPFIRPSVWPACRPSVCRSARPSVRPLVNDGDDENTHGLALQQTLRQLVCPSVRASLCLLFRRSIRPPVHPLVSLFVSPRVRLSRPSVQSLIRHVVRPSVRLLLPPSVHVSTTATVRTPMF